MELNNGATVLKKVDDKVLAIFRGEFVTWTVNDNGDAFWGHYFNNDLDTALEYFNTVTTTEV